MGWKRQDAMCGVGIDHKPDELDFDLSMMTTSRSRVLEDRDFVLLSLVCCVSKATYLRRMDAVRNTKKKTRWRNAQSRQKQNVCTTEIGGKNWGSLLAQLGGLRLCLLHSLIALQKLPLIL